MDSGVANQPNEATRRAIALGELDRLDEDSQTAYYHAICESLGLNPLTRPLEYLELNGRLTLYAKRDATDQLRHKHQVSIEILDRTHQADVYVVRARATLPDGRTDESLGAVSLAGLEGEALANALMKAETKAKRRVALSICGLGLLDETEVETIPNGPSSANGSTPRRLGPGAIFNAWDAQGHPSRKELYDWRNSPTCGSGLRCRPLRARRRRSHRMPPDATGLRFDPVQHRYWTGTRELLSVTHVLQTAGVIDSLWFTPASRDRGTRVHAALEQLERHEACAIDAAYEPYLEGYRQFLHDARPVWHGIEIPVADVALGYAGRPDRWGTLQRDPVVVEIKT
ncbi:MAG: hypothetical protein DMF90_28905, partial [Acidobacteria bacterium]